MKKFTTTLFALAFSTIATANPHASFPVNITGNNVNPGSSAVAALDDFDAGYMYKLVCKLRNPAEGVDTTNMKFELNAPMGWSTGRFYLNGQSIPSHQGSLKANNEFIAYFSVMQATGATFIFSSEKHNKNVIVVDSCSADAIAEISKIAKR